MTTAKVVAVCVALLPALFLVDAAYSQGIVHGCLWCEDAPTANCGYQSNYHYEDETAIMGFAPIGTGARCHQGSSCAQAHGIADCVAGGLVSGQDPLDVSVVLAAVQANDMVTLGRQLATGRVRYDVSRGVLHLYNCSRQEVIGTIHLTFANTLALRSQVRIDGLPVVLAAWFAPRNR